MWFFRWSHTIIGFFHNALFLGLRTHMLQKVVNEKVIDNGDCCNIYIFHEYNYIILHFVFPLLKEKRFLFAWVLHPFTDWVFQLIFLLGIIEVKHFPLKLVNFIYKIVVNKIFISFYGVRTTKGYTLFVFITHLTGWFLQLMYVSSSLEMKFFPISSRGLGLV